MRRHANKEEKVWGANKTHPKDMQKHKALADTQREYKMHSRTCKKHTNALGEEGMQ